MIHSRFSGRNISLQLELVKLDILFLYKRITTRYSSADFEFANWDDISGKGDTTFPYKTRNSFYFTNIGYPSLGLLLLLNTTKKIEMSKIFCNFHYKKTESN